MPDEIDRLQEHQEMLRESQIRAALKKEIPVGVAGECFYCGEESPRLVGGNCAPCRDKIARIR